MKFRVLSIIIACLTCIFTVIVFLNFLNRWRTSEALRDVLIQAPLFMKHLLISPEQIGIQRWHHGDAATYQLKNNTRSQRISFAVAAETFGGRERHWLRTDGLVRFNEVSITFWRLLSETSLRPGTEADGFFQVDEMFLFPLHMSKIPQFPVVLQDLGTEIVKTPAGEFESRHYFAKIRSPGGNLEPLLELWASSAVPPLGIIRARWRDETLDLVDVKSPLDIETPQALSSTSRHHRIREQGCVQCHQDGIGGRNLNFPAKYLLRGRVLNLTECLFHYYQTGLIKRSDPVRLYIFSKFGKIASGEFVRLTWTKGSLWIKANPKGALRFSLDAEVSEGNLRAISRSGTLVLNLEKE